MDKKQTIVRFLFDRHYNTVFAYFPYLDWNKADGSKTSYSSIGQHVACSPAYARKCKRAQPAQYEALKKELESLGYNLKIKP